MIDYAEKRHFIRMPMQCPILMRSGANGTADRAELCDLSANGLRFRSSQAFDEGTRLQVVVEPGKQITPPLEAAISVVRCREIDQGFEIAAEIQHIEPAVYADSRD